MVTKSQEGLVTIVYSPLNYYCSESPTACHRNGAAYPRLSSIALNYRKVANRLAEFPSVEIAFAIGGDSPKILFHPGGRSGSPLGVFRMRLEQHCRRSASPSARCATTLPASMRASNPSIAKTSRAALIFRPIPASLRKFEGPLALPLASLNESGYPIFSLEELPFEI